MVGLENIRAALGFEVVTDWTDWTLDLLLKKISRRVAIGIDTRISVWITAVTIRITGHKWSCVAAVCNWSGIVWIGRIGIGKNGNTNGYGNQAQEEKNGNLN